jgi:O-antigen ligase
MSKKKYNSKSGTQATSKTTLVASYSAINIPVLFFIMAVFLILFLPWFQINSVLDFSLMPRIFALSLFLTLFSLPLFIPNMFGPKDFGVLKSPLLWIWGGFLLVTFLSHYCSRVPQEGWFESVKTALFLGVLMSASLMFVKTENWEKFLPPVVAIAAFIALGIGAEEYIHNVVRNASETLKDGRPTIYAVVGRMSHKNEYSNALMLMIPFLAYGVYRLKLVWKLFCGLALAGVLVMILLIKTRAVWVGILGAGYMITLASVLFHKRIGMPTMVRNILGISMLILSVGLLYVFTMDKPADDFSFLGRIYSLIDTDSHHNIHRIKVWFSTWEMIKDRFWLGRGPGNWNLEYMPYIEGKFDTIAATNWGRPHNDFLWVFSERGVFGFVLYMLFFGFLFAQVVRILLKHPEQDKKVMALLLMGGVVSYMAIAFFSFPLERINHQVYLALMASGIIAIDYRMRHNAEESAKGGIAVRLLGIPIFAMSAFGIYYGDKAIKQEEHIKLANVAYVKGDNKEIIKQAELSRNPFRVITNGMRPTDDYHALAYERLEMWEEALAASEKALEIYPENLVTINRKGLYLFKLNRYEEAAENALKAMKIVPLDKKLRFDLAVSYFRMGRYQDAFEALEGIPKPERYEDVMNAKKELRKILNIEEPTPAKEGGK